jgi:YD repeat-containing protein
LSNLIFSYQYDSFGRLKLLSAKVGSISLPTIDYAYNQRTGRIEAIANFRYYDRSQNESFLTDGIATYSKTFDASHYLLQLSLVITDKEVFRMDLYHNSNGALVQSKTFMRHLGASKMRVQNYTYDNDSQLIEVTGKENAWKFSYDDNGNLATMQYMGNRIDILYDSGDRILSFGDTPYITDLKGFVIQRGEERFTFNVLGQLLRVTRASRYDVRYLYDSNGRLSVRKDSYGNVTQYFYGDILRPNLVTHTFNNADGRVTTIIYDDQNVPIMIQVCLPFISFNTLKPLYLEHVDKWFLKYTYLNYIELILKTSYLHVQDKEVLLYLNSLNIHNKLNLQFIHNRD